MGMHAYLQGLNNLETLNRAPGYFQYQQHSVSTHSFRVTQMAQMLGDLEEISGHTINWRVLYEKALNHDYTERFIGDIKTPVKYATSELRELIANVEDSMTESFIKSEIPQELQERYRRRLSEGKDETLEGQILSISDKMDLLYEAFGEIQKGNPQEVFMEIYRESLQSIKKFNHLYSVQYFFENILPEMLSEDFPFRTRVVEVTNLILE